MKIVHLINSSELSGSGRQLQLLGAALAGDANSVEVCCLGPATPWLDSLRQAGVIVHALNWTRWVDPSVVLNLRAVLRESAPDVIHVWRLPTLRTLALVAADWLPRVVMSAALPAKGNLTWWDRRLLQQVRCLAFADESDRERCIRHGVAKPVLRVVPALVPAETEQGTEAAALNVACVGPLERESGFRDAVWAFDFVRYLFSDATLRIVGAGSQRAALAGLVAGLQSAHAVRFYEPLEDATRILSEASVVWIPSLANCGRQVALEAMARGKAVIASDVPCLRELIDDGATGYLIPPSDVVALARRTRVLLQDAALRSRFGEAARQQIQRTFPPKQTLERWQEIYRSAAA